MSMIGYMKRFSSRGPPFVRTNTRYGTDTGPCPWGDCRGPCRHVPSCFILILCSTSHGPREECRDPCRHVPNLTGLQQHSLPYPNKLLPLSMRATTYQTHRSDIVLVFKLLGERGAKCRHRTMRILPPSQCHHYTQRVLASLQDQTTTRSI